MSIMLLTGCAELPFATVRGTTININNPTGRNIIAKVTCSCRVFDGEYDRYFVLEPFQTKTETVRSRKQNDLVCAIDGFEYKTPAELRLETEQELARRRP
jgi:hypothetical protein